MFLPRAFPSGNDRGSESEIVLKRHGQVMPKSWQSNGQVMGSHGQVMAANLSPGYGLVIIHGLGMSKSWPSHGQYMTNSWQSHGHEQVMAGKL